MALRILQLSSFGPVQGSQSFDKLKQELKSESFPLT